MKNESMEQLNALKSCPFSPGAIWSEQQVMSMARLNPESFKCTFNGFKRNLTWKNILKIGVRAIFAGQAGTITSFIFYEALSSTYFKV